MCCSRRISVMDCLVDGTGGEACLKALPRSWRRDRAHHHQGYSWKWQAADGRGRPCGTSIRLRRNGS